MVLLRLRNLLSKISKFFCEFDKDYNIIIICMHKSGGILMEKEKFLGIINEEEYKIILELLENGKLKEYRFLIDMFDREKRFLLDSMDKSPKEIYQAIIYDYLKSVKGISQLVPGLSTGIYDAKSAVSIYTYDGKLNEKGILVDENTRFDLASSTKLFTALEALKLAEEGKFDLEKPVSSYKDGKYKNLDIPVSNMAKFYYDLRTDGRLDEKDGSLSLMELQRRLSETKVLNERTFVYSDIPFIILKDILPNSDEYFKKYFNDEMNLLSTGYDRNFGNLTGMRAGEMVNDPKAQVMERYSIYPGHAGIYSTSLDLVKLFKALDDGFLSHESMLKLITPAMDSPILLDLDGKILFNKDKSGNSLGVKKINRGMGVYYNHPEGIRISEMPAGLSDEAFAIAGFTGTWATFDLKNGLTANILANPLSSLGEKEFIIDNEKFKIVDCGKKFADGVKFKVLGKTASALDDNIPFTRITNTLKEDAIYTLLKLRLAKNVLMRKASLERSSILSDEVINSFECSKIVGGR